MDQWKAPQAFSRSVSPQKLPPSTSRQRPVAEMRDARKVQKAGREKLRRGCLNEQFHDLGSTLDPDRPKNDKASILTDTIEMLKDLTSEVNRLKAECAALTEESRELTQEKNELREEKASIKADIENLNVQYQQRMRALFPWGSVDPSLVMVPPYSYTVPVPVPVQPAPIHMQPTLQPFMFFGNQHNGAIPGPCSTFIPYPAPTNSPNGQPSSQYASTSRCSGEQDSRNQPVNHQRSSNTERCDDSSDVGTELELKMPGSSAQKDMSTEERKGKECQRKDRNIANGGSSSKNPSSQGLQGSSSNSVGDVPKSNN